MGEGEVRHRKKKSQQSSRQSAHEKPDQKGDGRNKKTSRQKGVNDSLIP